MLISWKQPESEEPGSIQYNEQMWRRQRNEKIAEVTQDQAEIACKIASSIICIC